MYVLHLEIHLFQITVARKPQPYGNCTSEYNNVAKDMHIDYYGVEYTEMVSIYILTTYIIIVRQAYTWSKDSIPILLKMS